LREKLKTDKFMKRQLRLLFLLILCMSNSGYAQNLMPEIYTKGGGFDPDKIKTYKHTDALRLEFFMFYPEDFKQGDTRPAVLFFFGGGWKGGHANQFYPQSAYLKSRGIIAICANYRTEKDGALPYTCVQDAKSAVRFIRENAKAIGVNPNKLAVGGGSAGGHLAAATATIKKFDSEEDNLSFSAVPNALVLFNPVYDNGPNGYGYERVQGYYKDFSPIDNLQGKLPPTIVFMGDNDKHTPVATTVLYEKRMKANGNRCETYIYENQKHGFFNLHNTKESTYFIDTVEKMDAFLVSLGYLSGPSTVKDWFAVQEKRLILVEPKKKKKNKKHKVKQQ